MAAWYNPMRYVKGVTNAVGLTRDETSTAQTDEDRARSQQMLEQFLAQQGTYNPQINNVQAAQIAQTPDVQAARVAQTPEAQAAIVSGPAPVVSREVNAPGQVQANRLRPVERVQAGQVAAPELGTANLGSAYTAEGQSIDRTGSDEIRVKQTGLLDGIIAAANGSAPSQAEIMLQRNVARVGEQAMGVAGSAPASQRAGSRRAALRLIADAGLKAGVDAAAARAGEMATARGQAAAATSDVRGADIGLATRQAELFQQAKMQAAGLLTDASGKNAGMLNEREALQGQMQLTAATGNRDANLTAAGANAAAANASDLEQARLDLSADTGNRDITTSVETGNAGRALAAAQGNQGTELSVKQGNQQSATTVSLANAGTAAANARQDASLETGARQGNQATRLTTNTQQAQLTQRADESNQDKDLKVEDLKQSTDADLRDNAIAAQGNAIQSTGQKANIIQEDKGRQQKAFGALASGAATAIAAKSDERAKDDLHEESPEKLREMFDNLLGMAFKYKPGQGPPGPRHGLVTRDLKKSDIGRDMVLRDSDGMEYPDRVQLIDSMAAMVADQNRRLDKLERRRVSGR